MIDQTISRYRITEKLGEGGGWVSFIRPWIRISNVPSTS